MRSGSRASLEPPAAPVCELTIRARLSAHIIRRMTTGFVLTLHATNSDVRGSSADCAISVRT